MNCDYKVKEKDGLFYIEDVTLDMVLKSPYTSCEQATDHIKTLGGIDQKKETVEKFGLQGDIVETVVKVKHPFKWYIEERCPMCKHVFTQEEYYGCGVRRGDSFGNMGHCPFCGEKHKNSTNSYAATTKHLWRAETVIVEGHVEKKVWWPFAKNKTKTKIIKKKVIRRVYK
jgi:hypothetical protein